MSSHCDDSDVLQYSSNYANLFSELQSDPKDLVGNWNLGSLTSTYIFVVEILTTSH